MYQELTGNSTAATTTAQAKKQADVAEFISHTDEPTLLLDLRALNGNPQSIKFDEFWDEIHKLFNEYQTADQERRHGDIAYLPFAISTRELIDRVQRRKPGILVPSEEWVRLQFSPENPCHKSTIKHTGRFKIKYMVQRRQMRSEHPDSKYAYVYYTYLKELAVKYRENTMLVFLDDKATIPVGEPKHAISTNVRAHNRSLGSENLVIEALDHDWKLYGLVPSVVLVCDIPDSITASFITGKPFVTTKEKVFEKSTPFHHAAELTNIVRSKKPKKS